MKTERIFIRVSEDEKELIRGLSNEVDMTISDYIMSATLLKKKLDKKEKEELRHLLIGTRKIGNNLNQISKSLNYLSRVEENKLILNNGTMQDIQSSINQIMKNQDNIAYFISKIL